MIDWSSEVCSSDLVPVVEPDPAAGTIVYRRDDGRLVETPVTGGRCKLQWKPDWAMRWYALDVDYEMSGKDLMDSVLQSGRICRTLGGRPPDGFTYELFLHEKGAQTSHSRGNGHRSDEGRVGKDCDSKGRCRWSRSNLKN